MALWCRRGFHAHEEFAIGRSGGGKGYGHGFNAGNRGGGRLGSGVSPK